MLRPLLDFTLVMVLSNYLVTGDYNISLVDGLDVCSGRVEIFYDGKLKAVCGDSWNIDAAALVCRELGCGRAVVAEGKSLFGVGNHHILSTVICKEDESSIINCSLQNENNCPQSNKAGVICSASSVVIIGGVVTAALLILCALLIIILVRRLKQKKTQIWSNSKDAVNMQDVLHNDENEEKAEDDYEIVDMDNREDVDSDSDQDYVNVNQDDSDPDYINVETDDSEQDYVNVDITEHRSTPGNNYEEL